ncbi:MAG TPA: lipoyl(octanoyl) transferase LipB [Nitrososphaerales archaeon]|nr:lipoyl(octanoyl) transferase LipB [Nitrososphaerales archaeon]
MTGEIIDLGRINYKDAWDLQRQLMEQRSRDQIPNTLLLLEHDHVITLGRKTSPENFRPQNVPVYQVERGGDATYHGPGQLVGYPIVRLEDHDVRKHVNRIEATLVNTLRKFGIEGELVPSHPGVWVGKRKIASIGVAVTNWVAYHGFALNVNTDLGYFELIRPCGLDPSTMTSMQRVLGREAEMSEVKETISAEFAAACQEAFLPGKLRAQSRLTVK